MIKNRLNILMAERGLNIAKVFKDTGISRTTLSSFINGKSQGIQFDTLNTLCIYLNVSIEDFISYLPFEFSFHFEEDFLNKDTHYNIFATGTGVEIEENTYKNIFAFSFKKNIKTFKVETLIQEYEEKGVHFIKVILNEDIYSLDKAFNSLSYFFKQEIPLIFIEDIENIIKKAILESEIFKKNIKNIDFTIEWGNILER